MMKMTKLATALSATLLATSLVQAEETKTSFYGTLRVGIDQVDAGTADDAANGRDYLSAVGVKASVKMDNGLTGLGQVEYGLRSDNAVDIEQMGQPTLRLATVGLQGDFGKVIYGSQSPLFHNYVRSAYFADGNDTVRLGTVRDDDLTHYIYTGKNYSLAAGIQTEGQDGDSIDSMSVAGDYKAGALTLQGAFLKDNRGDNKGRLAGVRVWYKLSDTVTLSAFRHQQSAKFDLYGGSTGNIQLKDAATEGTKNGINNCSGEKRANTGLYAAYTLGTGKVHARYAVDSCDTSGDVTSTKVEYMRYLAKNYSVWASYEMLNNDDTRKPTTSSGDDMSEAQLGVRFDF